MHGTRLINALVHVSTARVTGPTRATVAGK